MHGFHSFPSERGSALLAANHGAYPDRNEDNQYAQRQRLRRG